MIRWFRARRERRDQVLLIVLRSRPSWSLAELHQLFGGVFGNLYVRLDRLERVGRVQAWFVDGPYPRTRRYAAGPTGAVGGN